jgi:hypothetical protein
MELVKDQVVTGATIFVDGKYFLHCVYTDCMLIYCGGDVAWSNTVFNACRCEFHGLALRATEFLQMIGLLEGQPQVPGPANALRGLQ